MQLLSDIQQPWLLNISQSGSEPQLLLKFAVRATQISPQLSGIAQFNIEYVRNQTPNAVSDKNGKVLSETVFVVPFALVDEFGNYVRQECNQNAFSLTSDLIIETLNAAFNEHSKLCDVFVKIQLNGFSTNTEIGAVYKGEQFGAGLNYQRYFREIYPDYPSQVLSLQEYKIQKKEAWIITMNICFGLLIIVAGTLWFCVFFELKRRKHV